MASSTTSASTSLEARDSAFFLQGQKIRLFSGAMHYFRIVPEYWEDRLLRLKACGLNCVETYVPWNLHEEVKGEFNFEGILNVRRFIELAHKLKLLVIFRPGPYICSEWDFGGLPSESVQDAVVELMADEQKSWLLHDPSMKVRSSYRPYLDAVDLFFAKLLPQVADLQFSHGGPIIAVQIENEYGSYGNDLGYMGFLQDALQKYQIVELLFTSDNGTGLQGEKLPGVLMTANFQEKEHGYLMREFLNNVKQKNMPFMAMEFWTGWFDHWTEKHHIIPNEQFEKTLSWILDQDGSVNFYMFHGGTNFGFMAGANEGLGATNEGGVSEPYSPDITSYDYDSPVSECGDLTDKYFIIQRLLSQKCSDQFPADLPVLPTTPVETAAYGEIKCTGYLSLEKMLEYVEPIQVKDLVTMEGLYINNGGGQGYGFILYRKQIGDVKRLTFPGKVKDRATVLWSAFSVKYRDSWSFPSWDCITWFTLQKVILNGREVETVDWLATNHVIDLSTNQGTNKLDILVENCGRVNYADFNSPIMNEQRKGLKEVHLDGRNARDWTIFPLEMKANFLTRLKASDDWSADRPIESCGPVMCRFTLCITGQPKDTFVHSAGWRKGVIFVNGFNLGRYWEVGPQATLYLPAPLLREGNNEVLIFELHCPSDHLTFVVKPELGETVIHKTIIPAWAKSLILVLKTTLRMGNWVWAILRPFVK